MSKSRPTAAEKQIVAQRAGGCCEYCRSQAKYSPDPFSIEHIVPRARGGTSQLDNLAFSCQGCNNRKYTSTEAIDPVSGQVVPLYHPRKQRTSEHFAWNDDFTLVLGLGLVHASGHLFKQPAPSPPLTPPNSRGGTRNSPSPTVGRGGWGVRAGRWRAPRPLVSRQQDVRQLRSYNSTVKELSIYDVYCVQLVNIPPQNLRGMNRGAKWGLCRPWCAWIDSPVVNRPPPRIAEREASH